MQIDELEEQVFEFILNLLIIVYCVEEIFKVMIVVLVSIEIKFEVELVMEEIEEFENDELNIEDNCCIQVLFLYNYESFIVVLV